MTTIKKKEMLLRQLLEMIKGQKNGLVQDDGSLTTNEIEKVEVLSKFFSSVFTHEPPGEWKIPELDITHPIKDLEMTEKYCNLVLHSLLSIREATYQRRTGKWNRFFDQNV